MPLHPAIENILPKAYVSMLRRAEETEDFREIENRVSELGVTDPWLEPYTGDNKTKYYKAFVQTVVPKIVPTLRESLLAGTCPEIEVTLEEAKQAIVGYEFGSPQDFLYGFTSARYPNWGPTLEGMLFKSACMTGQGRMVVTMAPRLLELGTPDLETQELAGSITKDFWESAQAIFGMPCFKQRINEILTFLPERHELASALQNPDGETASILLEGVTHAIRSNLLPSFLSIRAKDLIAKLESIREIPYPLKRKDKIRALLKKHVVGFPMSQEQIALKYLDEGKFLQKILDGSRVEHIQSNVKMVTNPWRKNKCEIDSIYRVIGEQKIILVEAKDKPLVARTQLYQVFETYRLKLPTDWEVEVVAVIRQTPNQEQLTQGFEKIYDLIIIEFDQDVFGRVTESLLALHPKRHYRWCIKRSQD
jgi:hypothetical protein